MHVTVCICTRNRGDSILHTLRSIVTLNYDDFDVVIVDQSSGDDTAHAVEEAIGSDDRFVYVRSCTVGASAARNAAIRQARGPLIAFTDDDCDVPVDWLKRIIMHFDANPRVGLICGEVRAASHDSRKGFIPDYIVSRQRLISSPWAKWRCRGIGANMAFRAEALRDVGAFDEMLGPGAPLYLADDYDLTYRMLKVGYPVLSVPDVYVTHRGYRDWDQAKSLMRRSGLGTGAAYMKHLRLGDVAVIPTLLHDWLQVISWNRVVRLRRHSGLAYALWYAWGMILSFRYGVDRRRRVYMHDQKHERNESSAKSALEE